jgi:hypothetical protein
MTSAVTRIHPLRVVAEPAQTVVAPRRAPLLSGWRIRLPWWWPAVRLPGWWPASRSQIEVLNDSLTIIADRLRTGGGACYA